MRARFHQMNKGSSRDKNIASWMESTYTEFAEDERRKMSQDSYRRNTMRTKSRAIKDPRRRLTLKGLCVCMGCSLSASSQVSSPLMSNTQHAPTRPQSRRRVIAGCKSLARCSEGES